MQGWSAVTYHVLSNSTVVQRLNLYVAGSIENRRKVNKSVKSALFVLEQCFSSGGKRLPGETSRSAIWDLSYGK